MIVFATRRAERKFWLKVAERLNYEQHLPCPTRMWYVKKNRAYRVCPSCKSAITLAFYAEEKLLELTHDKT